MDINNTIKGIKQDIEFKRDRVVKTGSRLDTIATKITELGDEIISTQGKINKNDAKYLSKIGLKNTWIFFTSTLGLLLVVFNLILKLTDQNIEAYFIVNPIMALAGWITYKYINQSILQIQDTRRKLSETKYQLEFTRRKLEDERKTCEEERTQTNEEIKGLQEQVSSLEKKKTATIGKLLLKTTSMQDEHEIVLDIAGNKDYKPIYYLKKGFTANPLKVIGLNFPIHFKLNNDGEILLTASFFDILDQKLVLKVTDNEWEVKDNHWSLNYDDYGFEIIGRSDEVLIQIDFSQEDTIKLSGGAFRYGDKLAILSNEGVYSNVLSYMKSAGKDPIEMIRKHQKSLKRLFKYPAQSYFGIREKVN